MEDKILLQVNIKDEQLDLIVNNISDVERRALANFLQHFIDALNNDLELSIEHFKKEDI